MDPCLRGGGPASQRGQWKVKGGGQGQSLGDCRTSATKGG
jgi:hypothetical protein